MHKLDPAQPGRAQITSFTLPPRDHAALRRLARRRKVPLGAIIRGALEPVLAGERRSA